jgi:hypothetical protein
MTRRLVVFAALVGLVVSVVPPAGAGTDGFLTSRRPQLVATAPGVDVIPILSTRDVIGAGSDAYQMSGIPDGLGAYRSGPGSIELFMNHELEGPEEGDVAFSRISHVTLNDDGEVVDAEYVIDGNEGYVDLCSSTLEVIGGTPWYFTGEETKFGKNGDGGVSIAMNAETGSYVETPHFGLLWHENVVPIRGLSDAALFQAEDGNAGLAQAYVYTAESFADAIDGIGRLRAFVPTEPTDRNPSPDDIDPGDVLRGKLKVIPQRFNTGTKALDEAAQSLDAFDFVRIEDAVADPNHPGVVYFADTGAANSQTFKGRVYKLRLDPDDPARARLSVVLDGDAGDDMFNPDGLGISDEALVVQEDRNYARSGYNRVLVYDLSDGSLTPVARTDPTPIAMKRDGGPGAWESSGVLDASELFGEGWWLIDTQADDTKVLQPGPSLEVDSAEGPGGQLQRIYIPGT